MMIGMIQLKEHDKLCPAEYTNTETCFYCNLIRRTRKDERMTVLRYYDQQYNLDMDEFKHNSYCPYQDSDTDLFCSCYGGEQYGTNEKRVFTEPS